MIRETYRSLIRVRGPNVGLRGLDWLGTRLEHAKSRVDELALSIRRTRNRELLRDMYAGVLETPPLSCNPAADTAIHTVTAHHHFSMYLAAIKSLLRYHRDARVVVHDDGSLDAADAALLSRHVPGAIFLARGTADQAMGDALARYPRCRKLREKVVNALELFDNLLLAGAPRIINMNSDVLFLAEPRALIRWIRGEDPDIVGVFEADPKDQVVFLARRGSRFSPHVTTALTCLYPDTCDLEFIESVLSESALDWFTAQNVYPLLYERQSARGTRFFDAHTYQASGVFTEGAIFRHYWSSTGKFTDIQARDSARVIRALHSVSV